MRTITSAFRTLLESDQRDYILQAIITLSNNTRLTIKNENLWSGGFSFSDAVSADGTLEIGAAIINSAKLILNNIYETYSDYDFTGARVYLTVALKLPSGNTETIRVGTYTVDETSYNGSLITLKLVDHMAKFDKAYSGSTLGYPARLDAIVRDACTRCGVTLSSSTFPNSDYWVQNKPTDGAVTYREVVSWCAQIAGGYARCNANGDLEIKRIPLDKLKTINQRIDNKTFNTGTSEATVNAGAHYISSTFSHQFSVDPIVITGIAVLQKSGTSSDNGQKRYTAGKDGYVVGIEGNQLVQEVAERDRVSSRTYTDGQAVADSLAAFFVGAKFYAGDCAHLSDPSMEAGDIALMIDRRGNAYPLLVSSVSFTARGQQTLRSSAEEPARQSATRFSQAAKSYLETLQLIEREKSARELALEDLQTRMAESPGLYGTAVEDEEDGSKTFYLHNKPNLEESDIVWKMTANAWGVSTSGNQEDAYQYGMTVDGEMIMNEIFTNGLSAQYIRLYGDMAVYESEGNNASIGGYIGYGEGAVYSSSYEDKTKGMHLTDTDKDNEIIVTSAGARMSHYLNIGTLNGLRMSNSVSTSEAGVLLESHSGDVSAKAERGRILLSTVSAGWAEPDGSVTIRSRGDSRIFSSSTFLLETQNDITAEAKNGSITATANGRIDFTAGDGMRIDNHGMIINSGGAVDIKATSGTTDASMNISTTDYLNLDGYDGIYIGKLNDFIEAKALEYITLTAPTTYINGAVQFSGYKGKVSDINILETSNTGTVTAYTDENGDTAYMWGPTPKNGTVCLPTSFYDSGGVATYLRCRLVRGLLYSVIQTDT